jgi:predicted ATPase
VVSDLGIIFAALTAPLPNDQLDKPLELHGRETSSQLQIPEKLYGRDHELKTLLSCFQKVLQRGRTEMTMVAGAAGSGKSRLVGELLAKIAATTSATAVTPVFASGKYDQYSRQPFGAIITAIAQLVDTVLMQDASVVTNVKDRMLHRDVGVGSNIGVAIAMIPAIKMITGAQPPPPVVGSVEAQHRLHRTLIQLMKVFASSATPLVLFVDDLQWADQASFKFLQSIATDFEFRHSLIIGSYRYLHTPSIFHPFPRFS